MDATTATIIAALIGVGGILSGVVVQYVLPDWIESFRSKKTAIPNIKGKWKGEWYIRESGEDKFYIEDIIDIEKYRGFRVFGTGKDEKGSYLIRGRFSMANIYTLSYQYTDIGYSLTGVMLLQINPLGKKLEGRWWGYSKEGGIIGGRVCWTRL